MYGIEDQSGSCKISMELHALSGQATGIGGPNGVAKGAESFTNRQTVPRKGNITVGEVTGSRRTDRCASTLDGKVAKSPNPNAERRAQAW